MIKKIISPIEYVENFIIEIKNIICSKYFNIQTDFYFFSNKEKNELFILEYDYQIDELLNIIKTLSVEDYSESTIKDNEIALVFGKSIEVEIYIKIKISEELRKKVICISFHEAEIPMKYPYKKGGQIK